MPSISCIKQALHSTTSSPSCCINVHSSKIEHNAGAAT